MRMRRIGLAVLLACAAAMLKPAVAETTDCVPITSVPWAITSPGVYCLKSDLTFVGTSGTAIRIDASNVTLDLNRHLLGNVAGGQPTSAGGIVVYQQSNVVIKNGSIQGFNLGVLLSDAPPFTATQSNRIEDIITMGASIGFLVAGQGNVLVHNEVSQTGGQYLVAVGILVIGADNVVRSNELLGVGNASANGYGIFASGCTGLILEGNRVAGIASPLASAATTILPSYGIFIDSSSHAVIRGNTVDKGDPPAAGYTESYGIGFGLGISNDIAVVGNVITTFYYGIYASSGSSVQTNGNVVLATVPVAGTTAAATY
jgi:Right handed beta helix region